ncbi:hypothetical protein D9619_011395 [Psilocybe cf. subviscida]|uniref:Uncharacterized protein n=1 Tax=Psilocybe cf. subviscida TaxID=2480587 RepID=A0A8H5BJE8_9AGAR|nr:hypothetical protein D9619_011395 [Psilocybe cf. subviscida]
MLDWLAMTRHNRHFQHEQRDSRLISTWTAIVIAPGAAPRSRPELCTHNIFSAENSSTKSPFASLYTLTSARSCGALGCALSPKAAAGEQQRRCQAPVMTSMDVIVDHGPRCPPVAAAVADALTQKSTSDVPVSAIPAISPLYAHRPGPRVVPHCSLTPAVEPASGSIDGKLPTSTLSHTVLNAPLPPLVAWTSGGRRL